MKSRNIVGFVARIIVGLVFIASAITKYLSIDAVDLFVYEHQIFSWGVTTFATRLLIAFEAYIGIMLILGIYARQIKWASIIMLVLFSVYVLLKPVLFNVDNENCHCFGTVLLLDNTQTLIKNIILLVISYFMFWNKGVNDLTYKFVQKKSKDGQITERNILTVGGWLFKQRKFIAVLLFVVLFLSANAINMPEPLARKIFPKTASINKTAFEMLIGQGQLDSLPLKTHKDSTVFEMYQIAQDSVEQLRLLEGKKILCLYSTGCKYCKRSAMRLDVVRQKYNIADSSFAIIFWGNAKKVDSFFVKTNTKVLPYTFVPPYIFLTATKGRQPIIVLLKDGKVEELLKYPNINEKRIREFLVEDK
jgi:uncharacterized membrane protein YphA (DoxX/SURF4 family)